MIYYAKENTVYASDVKLLDDTYKEISEQEYNERLRRVVEAKEVGILANVAGDWVSWEFSEATESDYINALESLGVNFNG